VIDKCIVCADYAQVPGKPHRWQQCPRLILPDPAERYRRDHSTSAYAGQFAPVYPGNRQGRIDWQDRVLQPETYTEQWAREASARVCICGDTAGCHQDLGDGRIGGCWACACSAFEQRTSAHRVPPSYGFRYTGD
jgi:hypothetical protein